MVTPSRPPWEDPPLRPLPEASAPRWVRRPDLLLTVGSTAIGRRQSVARLTPPGASDDLPPLDRALGIGGTAASSTDRRHSFTGDTSCDRT